MSGAQQPQKSTQKASSLSQKRNRHSRSQPSTLSPSKHPLILAILLTALAATTATATATAAKRARSVSFVYDDLYSLPKYDLHLGGGDPDELISETRLAQLLAETREGTTQETKDENAKEVTKEIVREERVLDEHNNNENNLAKPLRLERTLMRAATGQRYLCTTPKPEEDELEGDEKTAKKEGKNSLEKYSKTLDQGIAALEGMEKNCLYFVQGWFTVEFCHDKHVRQYHRPATDDGVHTPAPQEGQAGAPSVSFYLGKSTSAHRKPLRVKPSNGHPNTEPEFSHEEYDLKNVDGRAIVSQLFRKGTVCDITGKPRTTEIQSTERIARVFEPSTCNYVISVETPRLCHIAAFRPQQTTISCNPVVSDDYHAHILASVSRIVATKDDTTVRSAPEAEKQASIDSTPRQGSSSGADDRDISAQNNQRSSQPDRSSSGDRSEQAQTNAKEEGSKDSAKESTLSDMFNGMVDTIAFGRQKTTEKEGSAESSKTANEDGTSPISLEELNDLVLKRAKELLERSSANKPADDASNGDRTEDGTSAQKNAIRLSPDGPEVKIVLINADGKISSGFEDEQLYVDEETGDYYVGDRSEDHSPNADALSYDLETTQGADDDDEILKTPEGETQKRKKDPAKVTQKVLENFFDQFQTAFFKNFKKSASEQRSPPRTDEEQAGSREGAARDAAPIETPLEKLKKAYEVRHDHVSPDEERKIGGEASTEERAANKKRKDKSSEDRSQRNRDEL